ncbi:phage tail protein [Acinetobacter baumannii]
MSTRKFIWCQDLEGNSGSQEFNTLTSKFGDGYEQTTSIGINNKSGTWQYTKTAKESVIREIKTFLDEHKGADSFLWDAPLEGEVRVKAGSYQPRCLGGDVWQISTTFTQVFYP